MTSLLSYLENDLSDRGGFKEGHDLEVALTNAFSASYVLTMGLKTLEGPMQVQVVHSHQLIWPKPLAADHAEIFISMDKTFDGKHEHSHSKVMYYLHGGGPLLSAEKLVYHVANFFCTGELMHHANLVNDMLGVAQLLNKNVSQALSS